MARERHGIHVVCKLVPKAERLGLLVKTKQHSYENVKYAILRMYFDGDVVATQRLALGDPDARRNLAEHPLGPRREYQESCYCN
jgi:hypothetical protein